MLPTIIKDNGTPLQYFCLENPMDRGAWWAAVHGVVKSRTWLSNFTFTFHFHALEKEMATHSSVLAWRIPGMGEPGGLPSMESHRVRHDWSDLAAVAAATKKNKQKFNNIYTSCILGETQKNWVKLPEMAQATTLNTVLAKDKNLTEAGCIGRLSQT